MITIDEDCRRLLSLIAHEMRSPGAVVSGYLRMLKGPSTSDMPGREQKMIEEANRSCARLMHLVQELSDFGELGGAVKAADVLKHQQMPFDCWRGGMGLSLPIAYRIVEAHHGNLWAMPGSRATCALALPVAH